MHSSEPSPPGPRVRTWSWPRSADKLVVLVASLGLFGSLSVAMKKDVNFDLRAYHYYAGYAALHHRLNFDLMAAGLGTYLNPVFDIPFYLLTRTLEAKKVAFVMGAIHGLNFWLLYCIAGCVLSAYRADRPIWQRCLALACAATGCYGPVGVAELGSTMNDLYSSIFVLAALWALLRYARAERPVPFLLSAMLLGFGAGGKLTGCTFIPGFVLMAALVTRAKPRPRQVLLYCLSICLGFCLSNGYWMYELYGKFRNPFFPFYNGVFCSSYWVKKDFTDDRFGPHGITQALTFPFYVVAHPTAACEFPYRDIRFPVIYVLVLGGVMVGWLRRLMAPGGEPQPPRANAILWLGVVSYVVWMKVFSITRYLVPLEMLAPIILVCAVSLWTRRAARLTTAVLVCFALIAAAVRAPSFGRVPWTEGPYFSVERPPLEDDRNVLVLLTHDDYPYGFVIPFFPRHVRFVRLRTAFLSRPGDGTRLQQEIWDIVRSHSGRIFHLSLPGLAAADEQELKGWGLAYRTRDIPTFRTAFDIFSLRQVIRVATDAPQGLLASAGSRQAAAATPAGTR